MQQTSLGLPIILDADTCVFETVRPAFSSSPSSRPCREGTFLLFLSGGRPSSRIQPSKRQVSRRPTVPSCSITSRTSRYQGAVSRGPCLLFPTRLHPPCECGSRRSMGHPSAVDLPPQPRCAANAAACSLIVTLAPSVLGLPATPYSRRSGPRRIDVAAAQ